jgi:hypothetical protein
MMINKQRIDDERTEKQVTQLMMQAQAPVNANMVIDQNVLSEIEKNGGFPRHHVIGSLQNDELNYATAYYYLLCTLKEF